MKTFITLIGALFIVLSPFVLAQDPGRVSRKFTVVIVSDGTGSLEIPSTYKGITQKQLLISQIGPMFKTMRNRKNATLVMLRLCGETSLLYDSGTSREDIGEVKMAASLIPCADGNGTNIVKAFEAMGNIIEEGPRDEFAIIFCGDGLHEVQGGKQTDAYEALKRFGKQAQGRSIRFFAMIGTADNVRLQWRTAAHQALGNFMPLYISGPNDIISTMREICSELEK